MTENFRKSPLLAACMFELPFAVTCVQISYLCHCLCRKVLLDARADPNGAQQWTPLMAAVGLMRAPIVKVLLEYHADPTIASTEYSGMRGATVLETLKRNQPGYAWAHPAAAEIIAMLEAHLNTTAEPAPAAPPAPMPLSSSSSAASAKTAETAAAATSVSESADDKSADSAEPAERFGSVRRAFSAACHAVLHVRASFTPRLAGICKSCSRRWRVAGRSKRATRGCGRR